MQLLTKQIKKAAESQFPLGSEFKGQKVVAKFFNPVGSQTWYLMNKDPKDGYCWGIVKWYDLEAGSFNIDELQNVKLQFGLGIERDTSFQPIDSLELWNKLKEGLHV